MDPLSITASILTLLGVCSAVVKTFEKVRNTKHVPATLYTLNNEVSDLQLVLLGIHDRREELLGQDLSNEQERRLLSTCSSIFERTSKHVQDTDALLRKCLLGPTSGLKSRLDLLFIAREHGKLSRLQSDIRDAKQSIQSLWGQLGLRQVS